MFVGLQNPSFPGWLGDWVLQKPYFFPGPTICGSLGSTADKYLQVSQVTDVRLNKEQATEGKIFSLTVLKWAEEVSWKLWIRMRIRRSVNTPEPSEVLENHLTNNLDAISVLSLKFV